MMEDGTRAPLISRRAALVMGLSLAAMRSARAAADTTIIKTDGGRDVQLTIRPAIGHQRGIVLFSHGALSAPYKYERLIGPWTQAGFKVLAPLHVDSTDHPDRARYDLAGDWAARVEDMRAVSAFANTPQYIAAGHSYGALTALALGGVSGMVPPGLRMPFRDPCATCVVAFSPPGPDQLVSAEGYGTLGVPALIETGTRDIPFGAAPGVSWPAHLTAYDAALPGDKYSLVLDDVDHYFGGLICNPTKPGPPQTEQLARAVALSIDFFEAYGVHNAVARNKLNRALSDSGPVQLIRK